MALMCSEVSIQASAGCVMTLLLLHLVLSDVAVLL
jgi:hypothetical protein